MPPTDGHFREAIAAAPDAALPRLAYADFLDDSDFPHHAAALRLDAAMAAERPWADRYWLLKADRDAHTPADFPGDLGWLSDRQPLLCGVPDDWRSRWRAVRAFVSRWWGVPLGDVGRWGDATHVAGVPWEGQADLPPAVREWDAFAAELADAPGGEDAFRDPIGLGRVPGHEALSLLEQAEGDMFWAVPDAELYAPGPPVTLYQPGRGDDEFEPAGRFAESPAGFALWYLFTYWPWQGNFADAPADAGLQAGSRFDLGTVAEYPDRVEVLLPAGHFGHPHARLGRFNRWPT